MPPTTPPKDTADDAPDDRAHRPTTEDAADPRATDQDARTDPVAAPPNRTADTEVDIVAHWR